MNLITATIAAGSLEQVVDQLQDHGIAKVTISEAAVPSAPTVEHYRGVTITPRLRRVFRVEALVPARDLDAAIDAILPATVTDLAGDPLLWVADVGAQRRMEMIGPAANVS